VDGQVHGEIPHPFYFNQPRAIDGTASGLQQTVLGTHIQALYLWPVNDKFDIMFSGGPSLIMLQQDLVSNVNFSETYPYDTATYESAQLARTRRTGIGFNAGADLTYHFTQMLGLGVLVRYTRATISLPIAGASNVSARAGGAQAGVGLRVLF
jgi:hypothetical protein